MGLQSAVLIHVLFYWSIDKVVNTINTITNSQSFPIRMMATMVDHNSKPLGHTDITFNLSLSGNCILSIFPKKVSI